MLKRPDLVRGYDWGGGEGGGDWQDDTDLTTAIKEVVVEELGKVVPADAGEYPVPVTVAGGPGPVLGPL